MKITFLTILALLSHLGWSSNFSEKYRSVLSSIDLTERNNLVENFSDLKLEFDDCSSFPYLGIDGDGEYLIRSSFKSSILKAEEYLRSNELPLYVSKKFSNLADILLNSNLTKTFHCRYGQTNSFIAIATSSIDDRDIERYDMADYPSIIFDTNRMAGNFPLDADPASFRAFYGNRLDGVEIKGGTRNPLMGKTPNAASLVFHEMLHWTGVKHFDKSYVDIIYLSQFCIFDHPNISTELSKLACDVLKDPLVWQADREKRLKYIEENELRELVKELKNLYHSHY